MKSSCRKLLAGLAILLTSMVMFALLSSPLEAQSFYGSIVGTVTDPSGAIIPSATVTVTNIGTNDKRTALTDAAGNYRFVNLAPANYRLEVEASGFKRLTRESIAVQVQSAVRSDARLEVGAVSETVEVSAAAPLLQTETATLGQLVEGQQVQQMPLNGRNIINLIALAPGVVPQGGAMGGISLNQGDHTNPAGFGNYQIGGGISGHNAMYVDGAPINVLYQNQVGLVVTQDAIQEFRVASNSVSSEFGRFGGGVVNLATKSGTNEIHGSAYEYLRNKAFNANTFDNNMQGRARPKWNQNQYGVTLGGPLVKDKVFAFFSWEGFVSRQGYTYPVGVPTADQLAGKFYRSNAATPVLNTAKLPASLTGCVSLGLADSRGTYDQVNVNQTGCVDPTAKYILSQYWPAANTSVGTNNYFAVPIIGDDHNQYNGRVDCIR
jgi:hypothetical protein